MEYNGKKIGFKRTIGAVSEIGKLCPDGKIQRIGEIFNEDNLGASLEGSAQFLAILNKWYEKSLVFTNPGYVPDPVPADWFLSLDMEEFMELFNEAQKSFVDDDKITVEAVEPKGKKNETPMTR